jgi:hypothetical protein
VTQQLSVVIVDFERTVMDAFMIGLAEEKGMVVRESFASVNVQKGRDLCRLARSTNIYDVGGDEVEGADIEEERVLVVLVADAKMTWLVGW